MKEEPKIEILTYYFQGKALGAPKFIWDDISMIMREQEKIQSEADVKIAELNTKLAEKFKHVWEDKLSDAPFYKKKDLESFWLKFIKSRPL